MSVGEPAGPVRKAFTGELQSIGELVSRLFALVCESLAAATDTFLAGDREEALEVRSRDAQIDDLQNQLEAAIEKTMLFQAPVAGDFRRLVAALRIVPELERSGDLAEHIAARAARGLGTQLSPSVRGIVEQLGEHVGAMWRDAAESFVSGDPDAPSRIDAADDEVNALHHRLWDEVAGSDLPLEVAMEMALVARFYERLGDHAVHVSERLGHIL
jgi:phosphate transport system protein